MILESTGNVKENDDNELNASMFVRMINFYKSFA